MKLTLRIATPADKQWAHTLHHQVYRDVVERQFGPWDEALQDSFFEKSWQDSSPRIIEADGARCGVLGVERRPDGLFVSELFISPVYQGHGIGTNLLRAIMRRAQRDHLKVSLRVLHHNKARRLYEKLGFKPVERTSTHVLMELAPK